MVSHGKPLDKPRARPRTKKNSFVSKKPCAGKRQATLLLRPVHYKRAHKIRSICFKWR